MKLTRKLVSFLGRVFDKSAAPVLALRLRYDGASMRWDVSDGVLSTTVSGGSGAALQINLAAFTVGGLASYLAAQPGYSVEYADAGDVAALSARVLLDASGDQDASNGDHLYAYTSLLWAWLDPVAAELKAVAEQIDQAVLQMVPQTASGEWLDELGMYYAVDRMAGEPDGLYAPRIIAEVLRPRGNNVAIASAVDLVAGGGASRVTDAPLDATSNSYGLFDLDIAFDLDRLAQFGMEPVLVSARQIVERFRDAGTQLRKLRALVSYNIGTYLAVATISGESTDVLPYSITDIESIGPMYFAATVTGCDIVEVYTPGFGLLRLTGAFNLDGSQLLDGF